MNFEIIREARKSLHMTQAELADKLEVNRATLSKYETGEIIPPLKQLEKLADVLKISAEDLLRRKVRASTIGDNIKHLRESHGMTQAELGQIAGVTDKAVSTWEADLKVPRMGAVQKMADYFQIPKSVILNGDAAPTIGEKIRKTRIEKGMTQKQVAEKCDMADSAIRKYESGKVCPKIETLKRIAEALGADFYSLADTEEEPRPAGDPLRRITEACEKLTDAGREKAAEIVEIIAGNPEYQRKAEDDITIIILEGR